MSKRRTRRTAVRPMPEPTPEPTPELRARRAWFMGLDEKTRCKLIRQTHGMGTKETGEFYRAAWLDALTIAFQAQFADYQANEFVNPTFVSEHLGQVEFRCFYDNYDNEEDSWTWYWNSETGEFYN